MPKKILATTIILALAIAMLSAIPMLKANFIPTKSEIHISSPNRSDLEIYQNTSVPIIVVVNVPPVGPPPSHYPEINHIYFRIDEHSAIEITNITKSEKPWFHGTCMEYYASAVSDNLEDGNHALTAYCQDDMGNQLSATEYFAYSNHYTAPNFTVFSPLNRTYSTTTQLPLTIIADDFLAVYYSIDNKLENHSLSGNLTLTGLTDGTHSLNVTVFTRRGIVSQTADFLIDNKINVSQSPIPSSKVELSTLIIPIVIAGVILAVVSILLVYLRISKGKP